MLSVNQLIGRSMGGYQIEYLLGQSQLGAAYLARQPEQGNLATVTIFNLPEGLSPQEQEQLSQRFTKEGEGLMHMAHPHILPIYAFGMQPEFLYLVTAFAKEPSLAQYLKQNDRFTPPQILPVLKQLAEGLDYAHSLGIVHGMLSLSNVMVSAELNVRIAGFGLRTILEIYGNPQSATPLTHPSHERNLFLLGNAEYISPERVLGLPMSTQADIYSLGVMLFALLSGTHPFHGTQPLDVALQRLQKPVPSLHTIHADISEAFDLVIGRAMERDPAKRPQHASDVALLFERVLKTQDPSWGLDTAAGQLDSDAQTTLPPTVNWFDEQVMPAGQWETLPPGAPAQSTTHALSDAAPQSAFSPTEAGLLTSAATASPGGTDPFAWWATTSTGQVKSAPQPGTFPWRAPIRKANAKLAGHSRPGQLSRRKLVTVLVTGAAVTGVTVTGISLARLLQSMHQSSATIANGPASGQTVPTGGNTPTAGTTQATTIPSASPTARPTPTPAARKTPTAQPTQPVQGPPPTPTPKPLPTPTPKPGHNGTVIGYTSQGNNSAVSFTNPANGHAGLLIRMPNGTFVACEKACTHAGVPCNYDSGSRKVVCPAHGATFDPANGFSPTNPAPSPLPTVSIRVNADGTVTTG